MSRTFHGPLSPVGAALGIALVALPYALGWGEGGATMIAWVAGPITGLVLLLVPGPTRHLATGLVASALTLPLLLLGVLLLGVAG